VPARQLDASKVDGAKPALAFALRMAGPPRLHGLLLSGSALFSQSSEFFRARGPSTEPAPADFVAVNLRRAGGVLAWARSFAHGLLAAEGRFEAVHAELPTLLDRDLGLARANRSRFWCAMDPAGWAHSLSRSTSILARIRCCRARPAPGHVGGSGHACLRLAVWIIRSGSSRSQ